MDSRFHRLAAREYREARTWYEECQAGLGAEFKAEVDKVVERIAAHPERWPVFHERFRRVRLRRFPYTLYYHVEEPTRLVVLAVAHDRRRPGYWLSRAST